MLPFCFDNYNSQSFLRLKWSLFSQTKMHTVLYGLLGKQMEWLLSYQSKNIAAIHGVHLLVSCVCVYIIIYAYIFFFSSVISLKVLFALQVIVSGTWSDRTESDGSWEHLGTIHKYSWLGPLLLWEYASPFCQGKVWLGLGQSEKQVWIMTL